ncbi:hypothetical protein [Bradyrhizobium elkanii]|uniref:hypothetical protein n=1 Tax=Bradyrhizobium elkanii TaxID=29448 RepID=UPI000841480B|nr:hypothetical protein [Bradyrhizobium elkanii]ODM71548.1 hypothetical protein A6X20_41205 [Bradyrhizobium elkanii]ODM72912.1 hypothetical protein A6452_41235 [Bradyrhizobium elkanii]
MVIFDDVDGRDCTGYRRDNMGRVTALRVRARLNTGSCPAVRNDDDAGLAVQFEENLDLPVLARLADRRQLHEEHFALFISNVTSSPVFVP